MLKKACEEDGFEVAFQPMFDTDGHFIDMAECLVRLYDRRHESYVSPLEFIPVAEAEGYIDQITSSLCCTRPVSSFVISGVMDMH